MSNDIEVTPLQKAFHAAMRRAGKDAAWSVIRANGGDPSKGAIVPAKNEAATIKALEVLVADDEDADEAAANGERLFAENRERQDRHERGLPPATPSDKAKADRAAMQHMAKDAYGKSEPKAPATWDDLQKTAMARFNSPPKKADS